MIYVSFSFFTAQSSFHSIHYYIVHLDGLLSWRAMAGNFQPQLSSQVFSSLSSQPAGEPETAAAGHSKNINKLSQAEVSSISGCFEGRRRGRPGGLTMCKKMRKKKPMESNANVARGGMGTLLSDYNKVANK